MTSVVYSKMIKGVPNMKSVNRWKYGIRSRMPDHYRNRMVKVETAHRLGTCTPVHYRAEGGYWKPGHQPDTLLPVQNHPIYVTYPAEADEGLWAGEGIVKGLAKKRKPRAPRIPKIWMPKLENVLLYSEILDEYYTVVVTNTVLIQLDECFSLDAYILKTPDEDLKSLLALKMKKSMMETLIQKSMYPDDPDKCEKIYQKYREYITYTSEELEWLGLSEQEAIEKQEKLESFKNKPRPLKEVFTEQFLGNLDLGSVSHPDSSSTQTPPSNDLFTKSDKSTDSSGTAWWDYSSLSLSSGGDNSCKPGNETTKKGSLS